MDKRAMYKGINPRTLRRGTLVKYRGEVFSVDVVVRKSSGRWMAILSGEEEGRSFSAAVAQLKIAR